ncbi:hypothetical protein BDZ89DRAFT_1148426 [Hymenopellis radicata]|nr:hypothetical protein BDZ89DRAFT_1148426 [Hymenopellis radicata]
MKVLTPSTVPDSTGDDSTGALPDAPSESEDIVPASAITTPVHPRSSPVVPCSWFLDPSTFFDLADDGSTGAFPDAPPEPEDVAPVSAITTSRPTSVFACRASAVYMLLHHSTRTGDLFTLSLHVVI